MAFWRWLPFDAENPLSLKVSIVAVIATLHSLFMLFLVTKESVREAAVTYARQLLLCSQRRFRLAQRREGRQRSKKRSSW